MNKIVMKKQLSAEVFELEVEAPLIAKERKAGQFVVLQLGDDFNERIPLTIADADVDKGTITLIVQAVGESTHRLVRLEEGDYIANLLGPLGRPTDVRKYGRVVIVGGGIGTAPAYPIARAMKDAGNEVRVIIGARNENLLICFERQRKNILRFGRFSAKLNTDGNCVFRNAARRRAVAAVWRFSFCCVG